MVDICHQKWGENSEEPKNYQNVADTTKWVGNCLFFNLLFIGGGGGSEGYHPITTRDGETR